MTIHKVKSWAHFFDAIKAGKKLHDLRKLDRDYKVGDILILQRYDNINGEYTGEELEVEITYITSSKVPCAFSSSALDRDYGIFSLKLLSKNFAINLSETDLARVNFDPLREPEIIKKGRGFTGGPIKNSGKPWLVGEKSEEYVISVSPNPNAEFYQNGGFGDNHR